MNKELNTQVTQIVDRGANFSPSTNEQDAGLVLDYIASLGWAVTVYTGPHLAKIACHIMRAPGDVVRAEGIETRPLAICQAFVKAMEKWG